MLVKSTFFASAVLIPLTAEVLTGRLNRRYKRKPLVGVLGISCKIRIYLHWLGVPVMPVAILVKSVSDLEGLSVKVYDLKKVPFLRPWSLACI